MKNILFLLLVFTSFLPIQGQAMITEIRHMEEAKPFIPQANNTLVVFDVDMTLTHSSEPVFQMSNIRANRNSYKAFLKDLTPLQKELLMNLVITASKSSLIEKQIPALISDLQQQSVRAIALTGALSGKVANIEEMTKWRFNTLQSLGFDFSLSFPQEETITFVEFPEFNESLPKFHRGILFTNGTTGTCRKGELLTSFLKRVNYTPATLVFIDDSLSHLQDVETAILEGNPSINFVGLHYTGAAQYISEEISTELFIEQWERLVEQAKEASLVSTK